MPIRCIVDLPRQRVNALVEGDVTVEDAIQAFDRVLRSPGLHPGFVILSDHRAVGRSFSIEDIHRVIEWMEDHVIELRPTRWAAVVFRPSTFGVMRMLGARAKLVVGIEVGVFTNLDAGEEWLTLPHPEPDSSR